MFGWCNFYHTEVGCNFNSPCGNGEECCECSAFINLITEDNKFDIDKKNELVYNHIIEEMKEG